MSTEDGRTLGGTEDASGATGGGGKLLSETRFYSSYSQHIDFGGRETGMAEQNAQSILQHGFRQSTNVNLLPPSKGKAGGNVVEIQFMPKASDIVYLVPNSVAVKGPNGWKIPVGWKPKPWEIIRVKTDNPPMYEEYKKAWHKHHAKE